MSLKEEPQEEEQNSHVERGLNDVTIKMEIEWFNIWEELQK